MLTVSEVGDTLMVALKCDVNGACYGVFPDCPLMDLPNPNTVVFYAYALLGQSVGHRLGLEVITPFHLVMVAILTLLVLHFMARLLGFL